MRQDVRVTTKRRSEADCICEALHEYGSDVKRVGRQWAVDVSVSAPELSAILAALKTCLDANGIASVKVTIDGRAYAMEGMA
jgi:hypothetical protein